MRDDLAVWQRVRDTVGWARVVPHPDVPVPAVRDGFVDFARALSTVPRSPVDPTA